MVQQVPNERRDSLKDTVNVTDIMRWRNRGRVKAQKIFDAAKSIDNDPYNLRPTEVPTELVFKVLNINQAFSKRIKEKQ